MHRLRNMGWGMFFLMKENPTGELWGFTPRPMMSHQYHAVLQLVIHQDRQLFARRRLRHIIELKK